MYIRIVPTDNVTGMKVSVDAINKTTTIQHNANKQLPTTIRQC
jgi:hypothetical protein